MNHLRIALGGNPNAGKTTLFNRLTGARQHVGNYPGITVEKKEGTCQHGPHSLHVIDLPGTYSLTAYSPEELVARDFLVRERPDVVVNIVDASNLERNLYLSCQFMELGVPLVLALNMIDVARDRGIEIDTERLSQALGLPVVPIVARRGEGIEKLLDTVTTTGLRDTRPPRPEFIISYGEDIDLALREMEELIIRTGLLTDIYPPRWLALKVLEHDDQVLERIEEADPSAATGLRRLAEGVSAHLRGTIDAYPEAVIADHRYGYIKSILRQGVLRHKYDADRLYTSDKIDKVVTHRLLGPIIMALVLFGLYQLTFTYSKLPAAGLESFFSLLSTLVEQMVPEGTLRSLLVSGIIGGVGGVLGFVPLIMLMFLGIAILEDSGYLARVAFMMDRVFRIFGLHGSSVMPFIVSGGIAGGCAVPGVMATRTLRSPKERLATLLTVPFMNCGAKLPVLALLISAFFSANEAQYLFLATLLAWAVALLAAKFLRLTVLRGEATPFVMELPPYRFPTLQGLCIHTWERTWQYIRKAGTVILCISVLIWAMMTFPELPQERRADYAARQDQLRATAVPQPGQAGEKAAESDPADETASQALVALQRSEAEEALQHSLAGRLGTLLEPVSRLAGFDWRTNIALIGGFAAKEVIVSTLGTAYAMGEVATDKAEGLGERLARDPHWNRVSALAALIFIMFYAPCFITVVCIAREAGSWKWAFFSMAFNTVLAFFLATLVYQIGTRLTG
ncbi:MAG: ferrous iron transport protein B [Desulfobulbaceae bacterium A2]|nr:MAG: ferrous iron transport protein B [Desulfobulbaceae bacterium A2]